MNNEKLDNEIENIVSSLLAKGKEVPEHLMNRYKESKKLRETIDQGLI